MSPATSSPPTGAATPAAASRWLAVRIALLYLLLGGLWILASGWLLHRTGLPPELIDRIELAKGWIFVAVTAMGLGWMLDRYFGVIRRAAESLVQNEARFRALFDHSPDGVLVVSTGDRRIVSANAAINRLLGYDPGELEGLSALELHPADYQPKMAAEFAQAEVGRKYFLAAAPVRRRDGSVFFADISSSLFSSGGRAYRVGVFRDLTEQRRTEAQLRQWADAFKHCAHGIAMATVGSTRVQVCNGALARILGRSVEEIERIDFLELYEEADRPRVIEAIAEADAKGQSLFEARKIRGDGSRFAAEVTIASVRDESGAVLYRIATVQDITDRKRADEALKHRVELQDQLAMVAASVPGLIYSFRLRPDGSMSIPFATKALFDVYGLQFLEVCDDFTPVLNRVHPDDRERLKAGIFESARTMQPWHGSFRFRHEMKGEVWVEGHSVPRLEADGGVIWHGFVQDVTAAHQAAEILRASETRFRSLIENAPDGIALVSAAGVITYASPSACRMFGRAADEFAGLDPEANTHPEDLEGVLKSLREVLAEPESVRTHEYRFRHANGDWIWIESTFTNLIGRPGVEAVVLNFRNVHDRKLAEQAVRERESLLRQMGHAAKVGGWEFDVETGNGRWTEEVANIHDVEPNTPATKLFGLSFYHGESRSRIEAAVERAIRTGEPYALEVELVTAKGLKKWVYTIGEPEQVNGRVVRLRGAIQDITERRRTEEALRESELRRTLALEAARMGTWDLDLSSGRVEWTGLDCRLWGFEPTSSSVSLEDFGRRIEPGDHSAMKAISDRAMVERQPFEAEYRVITPDGEIHWMRSHGRHLFDATGRATRIVGVVFEVTERKLAEAALEAEATRRRILIDGSRDGIVVLDREGRVFEANRRFAEMLGYSVEEVGGLHVWDWDRTWPVDRVLESIRKLGPEGERFESRHTRKDGTCFDVELSNSAADLGGHKLVFCVCHDITERKKAEAKAARDAQRAQFLLELHQRAPGMADQELLHQVLECAIRVTDSCDGILEQYSEDGATIQGFVACPRNPELQGVAAGSKSVIEPMGNEYWAACLRELRPLTWQDRRDGRRGLALPVAQSGRPRILCVVQGKGSDYDEGDIAQLQEVVGELHKLILLRGAQNRLRLSEQRFRNLVETAFDWVWETNPEGYYTYASPRVRDILGYTPAEVVGRKPTDLMPADSARKAEQVLLALVNARAALTAVENVHQHKDGRKVVLETSGVPVFGGHGEFLGYRGMDRDVSERRRLESQLRQVQKLEAIGQLAGGVAHDFNNILAAILLQVELMQMNPGLDAETRTGLKDLELEAQRAASLTRQLLMFSRRSVLDIRPLDLNEVVKGLLKMLGRLIGEHIKLLFDGFTGILPLVNADAGMIEQVLMNLAVNARDAMPRGGRVTIATTVVTFDSERKPVNAAGRHGRFVCLTVADDGVGMSGELMERIFEPFFTTKEPGKGTGLGLATVHGIVAQHKGWVEVESSVGVGTTFHVYLPALDESLVNPGQVAPAVPLPRGSETILVVEDEEPLRRTITSALGALGYRVLEAANGPQAQEIWHERGGGVDLVFTDMVMPDGLTGLELAERLRADRPGLPVIISSGYSTEIVESGGINQPGICYLPKPYQTRSLAEAIRLCLGGSGSEKPKG